MQTRSQASWREDFNEAVGHFEEWRSTRRRGARIPESLWQSAIALAGRHGIAKTAATLKLDYYTLKKRQGPGSEGAGSKAASDDARARFVELPPISAALATACVLELEAGGSKLRVELEGIGFDELGALIRSVWKGQPA